MSLVPKHTSVRLLASLKSRPGINIKGEGWQDLPGASLVSHDSGSRSVTQVPTFRGIGVAIGAKTIETVTYDLSAVLPYTKPMQDLRRADRERFNLIVRHDFYGSEIIGEAADAGKGGVTIAAPESGETQKGGVVTFTGTDTDYTETAIYTLFANDIVMMGDVIMVGNANYIINYVEVDNTKSGAAQISKIYVVNEDTSPATVISVAAVYKIREGGGRMEFGGKTEKFGSFQADASGSPALSSGVSFRPNSPIIDIPLLLTEDGNSGW